ncbi:MAG TPA: DNA gyrase inhibitor YacG [Polyangia bacterium]|nr:DNA gyrase inhibitor YacG [Polyangia bacterium]
MAKIVCPLCKTVITAARQELPTWPFCSARCRSADLGSWLTDSYRISSAVAEEDLDQGLSPALRDDNNEDDLPS